MNTSELPFWDCLIKWNPNDSLNLTIYQKPTHSIRHIDFNFVHPFSAKILLTLNLFRRATRIITLEEDKVKEKESIINILRSNSFPIDIVKNISKQNYPSVNNSLNERPWICTVVLPQHQGMTKQLQRILKSYKTKTFCKNTNTLRNTFIRMKYTIPFTSTQNFIVAQFYKSIKSQELFPTIHCPSYIVEHYIIMIRKKLHCGCSNIIQLLSLGSSR